MAENQEIQFAVQRIYLKDASFETPQGPSVFTKKWEPRIQLDVNTSTNKLDDDHYEAILRLTLTAEQEEKTVLLIEVEQAGIFFCRGLNDDQLRHILATRAPEILFPYLRETVDAFAVRGSFPAFMLAPINFDALFQQAMEEQAQQNATKH